MREGWTYKKLGEVAFYSTSRVSSSSLDETNYVGVDNLLKDRKGKIDSTVVPVEGNCIGYKCGDILVGNIRPYLKKIWLANNDGGASGDVLVIRANNHQELHPDFLYWALSNDAFFEYNMLHSKGAKMPRGNKVDILKYIVPVPPLSEQQSIVAELDKINELISLKKAQLSDLDSLAQSIFYDMFGDPIENEKGWEVKKLGEITEPTIGLTYKPDNVTSDGTGTIVLRSSNIQNSKLDFEDIVRVNVPIKDNKYVKEGDILMCSRNGSFKLVGKVAMIHALSEKMSYGAFMTIIQSEYNPYLFGYFKTSAFREYLIQGKTTTVNQITVQMLKEIELPLPPLSLQQEFAKRIELIEQQKAQISSTIKDLETLLASRMQYWFD